MIGRIICWALLVALTVVPILSRSRQARIFSVSVLLVASYVLLWHGLRLAARNVPLPDHTTLKSQVPYADAWQDGRMATQAMADAYLVPFQAIFIALGILALSPVFTRRSQPHGGQISFEGAPSAPPNESSP